MTTPKREIFLDHNASHPMLESVRKAMAQKLLEEPDFFSNPMSVHHRGRSAKRVLYEFREALCQWLGLKSDEEVVINAGATEGINTVIRGFVANRLKEGRKPVVLYSSVEHSAIKTTCQDIEALNHKEIPVYANGLLDEACLFQSISELMADDNNDLLLVFQLANNETGICFDFSFQQKLHVLYGPKLHTHLPKKKGGKFPQTPTRIWTLLDGAQALAKLDEASIRKALHYADYLVLSSHKIGGPLGVGALWVRPGSPFESLVTGGAQEKKRRGGTHNLLGVYGFTIAIQDWMQNAEIYRTKMRSLRDHAEKQLLEIPDLKLNVDPSTKHRLCNTINLSVADCPDESLLMALDLRGVYISSGAACNSGSVKPSPVLMSMGFGEELARSSIRVSLGVETTAEDMQEFIKVFRLVVEQVRNAQKIADELLPNIELHQESELR